MSFLTLLLFIYPILEIWLMFKFAIAFGFWTTFFLSFLLVALGASLVMGQWQKMMTDFAKGEKLNLPYLLKYANKAFAGILIMLPGFISLAFAVLLLIPFTRKIIASLILSVFSFDIQMPDMQDYKDFRQNFQEFEDLNQSYKQKSNRKYTQDLNHGRVFDGEIVEQNSKSDTDFEKNTQNSAKKDKK